jgi:hypothetical protein
LKAITLSATVPYTVPLQCFSDLQWKSSSGVFKFEFELI